MMNRILRNFKGGHLYDPRPRHIELIFKALDLEHATSRVTPGSKSIVEQEEHVHEDE